MYSIMPQQKQNQKQAVHININTEPKKAKRKYVRRNQSKKSAQQAYNPSLDVNPGGRGLYRGTVNPPLKVNQPDTSASTLLAILLHNQLSQNTNQNMNQHPQLQHTNTPEIRYRNNDVQPEEIRPIARVDRPIVAPRSLIQEIQPAPVPKPATTARPSRYDVEEIQLAPPSPKHPAPPINIFSSPVPKIHLKDLDEKEDAPKSSYFKSVVSLLTPKIFKKKNEDHEMHSMFGSETAKELSEQFKADSVFAKNKKPKKYNEGKHFDQVVKEQKKAAKNPKPTGNPQAVQPDVDFPTKLRDNAVKNSIRSALLGNEKRKGTRGTLVDIERSEKARIREAVEKELKELRKHYAETGMMRP